MQKRPTKLTKQTNKCTLIHNIPTYFFFIINLFSVSFSPEQKNPSFHFLPFGKGPPVSPKRLAGPGIGIDVATGMTSKIFAPHGRRDLLNVEARKVHSEDRRWKRCPKRCVAIAMPLMIFQVALLNPQKLSVFTYCFLGIGFRHRES